MTGERIQTKKLETDDWEENERVLNAIYKNGERIQLGGYPSILQNGDLRDDCESASKTILSEVNNNGIEQWRLIFQIDSSGEYCWEDGGLLYFWIRNDDAKERKFDNSWMILRSC